MKNIIAFILVLVSAVLNAQIGEVNKIIPLSPNAAAFARYGEIPVSNFTGTANVSIPIYTIKTKEFNLPLELSYHTGGNRVEDIASWVGLGWSMGAVPMISRSVKGIPDEATGGFFSKFMGHSAGELFFFPQDDQRRKNFLNALKDGSADSEPDIFSFSILGKSGKFIYDQEHNKFVTLEESQIKISYENDFFTLTTEEGYEYFFSEKEITFSNGEETATGWYVSRISSPNKNEDILFEYDLEVHTLKNLTPKTKLVHRGGIQSDTGGITSGPVTAISTVHANLLKKISFNGGTVEFNRNETERLDLQGGYGLKTIKVKNLSEQQVLSYEFEYKFISGNSCYSNETYTNKWMLLEKFKKTSDEDKPITHSFFYDDSSIPPCRNSPAQDYWGYYNGADGNVDLIPTLFYNSLAINGANRFVNPDKSQFAILKKIEYPTGGYTEFNFENNTSNSTKLPAIYLDDVSSIDGNSTTGLESSYETTFTINNPPDTFLNGGNPLGGSYADLAMGCDGYELKEGIADANVNFLLTREESPTSPAYSFYISRSSASYYLQNGNYRLTASINAPPGEDLAVKSFFVTVNWKKLNPNTAPENSNRYIGGLRVKEIRSFTDPLSLPIVKKYKYTEAYDSQISSGKVFNEPSFVFEDDILVGDDQCEGGICAGLYHRFKSYNNVQQISYSGSAVGYETVIEESNDPLKTGVTIYKFTHSMDSVDNRFPYPPPTSMELYRGQPKEITHYKKNGSQLTPVEKREFEYNAQLSNSQISLFENMVAFKIGKFGYFGGDYDFKNGFAAVSYEISTNIDLLASEKITSYFSDGNLIAVKTYKYKGSSHIQLTSLSTISSNEEDQETKYYYPQDSEMSSEPFIHEFISGNRLSVQLDTQTFRSGVKLSEQKTVYDKSASTSNMLLAKSVCANKGAAAIDVDLDKKITYDLYDDKGNILQYTQEGGLPVSIIWGYNKTQPIAKIENLAYTSITPQAISTLQTLSNDDSDNCMSGNCSEQVLRNALNSFRDSFPDAFISTYTYNPLVGVTSITDPKGFSSYYEYDRDGRLRFVKDKDLNVLQKYCYNYKGQTMDCDDNSSSSVMMYKSAAQSGSFVKNDCASGGSGSTVSYSQHSGAATSTVSQAEADALGLAKFNADGQNYANANGYCTYYSSAQNGSFTKNNCASIASGSAVSYSQSSGAATSTASQADADALGLAKFNADGQNYANANGYCTYYSAAQNGSFTKNDCAAGASGSSVSYSQNSGVATSTASQAEADALGYSKFSMDGQNYANANGYCTYYSAAQSGSFTKNNCAAGGSGSTVAYSQGAGASTSIASQADADALGYSKFINDGQANANATGGCTFYSAAHSGSFVKNNCAAGGSGSTVSYSQAAGAAASNVSQADADASGYSKFINDGQAHANANGGCTFYSAAQNGWFTKNNCDAGGSGSSVSYSQNSGAATSTASQAEADALGYSKFVNDGQAHANVNGYCTYYSAAQSGSFAKNNCAAGGSGSTVAYSQGIGASISTASQADADALGYSKFINDGQAHANASGGCTFYSVGQNGSFTKNNCAAGGSGSTVAYSQQAGAAASNTSQSDADALGYSKFVNDGQAHANANGYCTFYSAAQNGYFTKNNCAVGGSGSSVHYSQAAGVHTSTVSQAEADALGYSKFITDGQAHANANSNGYCTFYSAAQNGHFVKNNCAAGGSGSTVAYSQTAGAATSNISQSDADALGYSKFVNDGQAHANANGYCTFYSTAQSGYFTKNNCAVGGSGSSVYYSQAAGAQASTVSQAEADALGYSKFITDGQAHANANSNGYCTFYSAAQNGHFVKNNCAAGGSGVTVAYSQTVGAATSNISQSDADALGYSKFVNDGQAHANANGYCTFYSTAQSGYFTKNNCAVGGSGSSVHYSQAAGAQASTVSQAEADAFGYSRFINDGQANANANGYCTFYSTAQSGYFTKNNCAVGGSGSSVYYSQAAGAQASTVSQAEADALGYSKFITDGQAHANANSNGYCTFYSAAQNGHFVKNNCAAGGSGVTVAYSQTAGAATSNISQSDADALGYSKFVNDGQAHANANGYCTFYSAAQSGSFTRNNCASGGAGGTVTYNQNAGASTSTISQAEADAQGYSKFLNDGQAYANANAGCTFYNAAVSKTFLRNNCPANSEPGSFTYTVPYGEYTSNISQGNANQQAQNAINAFGQNWANEQASCTFYSASASATFTRNNCGANYIGGSAAYSVGYGAFSSTVSQADADTMAYNHLSANGQAYANSVGSCTAVPQQVEFEHEYYFNASTRIISILTSASTTAHNGATLTFQVNFNRTSGAAAVRTVTVVYAKGQADQVTDVNLLATAQSVTSVVLISVVRN